jgi:hypothetical protein
VTGQLILASQISKSRAFRECDHQKIRPPFPPLTIPEFAAGYPISGSTMCYRAFKRGHAAAPEAPLGKAPFCDGRHIRRRVPAVGLLLATREIAFLQF